VESTYSFGEARQWFESSPEEKLFFCRFTQLPILLLLTSAAVLGSDKKMPGAWDLWDKVCADDRVAYLSEAEAIAPELRRQSRLRTSSPKVWADAYLIGRLPEDDDSWDGRSTRNTSEVSRHCKAETIAAAHNTSRGVN
jgi:hypothetical protein